ncbi:MAG: glycosyltransferase [Verrucomicrobiales bacterium]
MENSRQNPGERGGQGRELPLVISLCGTYLKAEMQSLYRQIANLREFRTVVFTERVENEGMFPGPEVIVMTKFSMRPRGNCLLRFWYKHVTRQWPPPREITKRPPHRYNLPQLLGQHAPALVHVYYGHKAVKYRKMLEAAGVPYVVSFHGVDVVKFTEDEQYVADLRQVFAAAKLVMARSESLLQRLEELGCPREKMRLNRTPIPFDQFPFALRQPPEDGRWRLLQACRLIPKKGLLTTLEALAEVVETWPDLVYVLCGSGPMEEELRERIVALGLGDNVELAGWLDQDALREQYARAHLFLHPSELTESSDQEGIPNSMLEAMAAGLPVVATLHGGIPEALESGVDGILVPEKSPRELAAAILELLGDPEKLGRMSRRAAESMAEKFGLESQVAKMEAVYAEAVELASRADSE